MQIEKILFQAKNLKPRDLSPYCLPKEWEKPLATELKLVKSLASSSRVYLKKIDPNPVRSRAHKFTHTQSVASLPRLPPRHLAKSQSVAILPPQLSKKKARRQNDFAFEQYHLYEVTSDR